MAEKIEINFPTRTWEDKEWKLLLEADSDTPDVEYKITREDAEGVRLDVRCQKDAIFRTGALRRLIDQNQHVFGLSRGGVEAVGGPQPAYTSADKDRAKPFGWIQEFRIRRGLV